MGKSNENEERKDLAALLLERKKIVYNLVLLLAAFVVVLFGALTMAWFARSGNATGNNAGITLKEGSFELEVKGDNIEHKALILGEDSTPGLSIFTSEFAEGNLQVSNGAYRTGSSASKIVWRHESPAGSYPDGLKPGSYGSLTFYVIPNETRVINITFRFDIRGYLVAKNNNGSITDICEIDDNLSTTSLSGGLTASEITDAKKGLDYVRGHILFFKDYSDGYYSGFSGTDSFSFADFIEGDDKTVTAGQAYPVTIYWKWVNSIADMVLDDNSTYKDSPLFAAANTTDFTAMDTYIRDTTNHHVFDGMSSSQVTTNLDALGNPSDTNAYYNSLVALTNGYDNADQVIGNNVHYILFEMTATEN